MDREEIAALQALYGVSEDGIIVTKATGYRHTAVDDRGRGSFYIGRKRFSARRVIWALLTGYWPDGPVRSVDGTQTNNAPKNLRCNGRRLCDIRARDSFYTLPSGNV